MRIIINIILSAIFFLSCSKSDEQILLKVSNRISDIETVKYDSRREVIDEGKILNDQMSSFAFDFRNVLPQEAKHYLKGEHVEIIYNGKKSFQLLISERTIITYEENDLEQINNPMFLSLKPLIQVLPKLIKNNEIIVTREKDTIINKNQYFNLSIFLKDSFIDWISADIKPGKRNSKYYLFIDRKSFLPYKIISPNGEKASISRTFENIQLDYIFPEGLWRGDLMPKDYKTVSFEEYYYDRMYDMQDHIGERIIDFELPFISSDLKINSTKDLKGKVVLLDFWWKGCGPCILAIPSLNEIRNRFKNDDFEIFGVEYREQYSKESLLEYIKKHNSEFPNLHKGKLLAANYGIMHAPTFMILDKNGKIIFLDNGYSEEKIKEMISIIETHV